MKHWHRCSVWTEEGLDCPFLRLEKEVEEKEDRDRDEEDLRIPKVPVPAKAKPRPRPRRATVELPPGIERVLEEVLRAPEPAGKEPFEDGKVPDLEHDPVPRPRPVPTGRPVPTRPVPSGRPAPAFDPAKYGETAKNTVPKRVADSMRKAVRAGYERVPGVIPVRP